ncbi:MAG: ribosome recycling factor [Chlamydiales bacterium]
MDVLDETKKKMNEAVEHLKHEFKRLRTGQANPEILDGVQVKAYGTQMRLLDVASISAPEPRQLLVTPFDASNTNAIAKGIEAANLNLQPMVDGNVVRIKIPEMDASIRQDLVKQARRKSEEAKVSIRNARRDGNERIKKQKSEGEIPEDLLKKHEKRIQEFTDNYCKTVDEITEKKEKEIIMI